MKGFTIMVLKQMLASVLCGTCTMIGKDIEQNLNQSWKGPNSNWLQGKRRLIGMILRIQNTRLRANTKISVTRSKKLEVISSLFLTLSLSLPSSLMVLAWQLSSLRILYLVRESKLPALGFYVPKASPSKERSMKPLEVKGVLWMTHLRSPVQL